MSTEPETPKQAAESKSVRVPAPVHAELSRVADHINGTMADAISFLLNPTMLRLYLTEEQRKRWQKYADANGLALWDFVVQRVEASLQYGADPGTLRRIHDYTLALVKAHNLIPNPSVPGADEQIVTARPRPRQP